VEACGIAAVNSLWPFRPPTSKSDTGRCALRARSRRTGRLPSDRRTDSGACQHHTVMAAAYASTTASLPDLNEGRLPGDKARRRQPRACDPPDARWALSRVWRRHPPGWA
jgi:hypothetical protein